MTTQVKTKARTLEEYLALPYTIEIYRDDTDGGMAYIARVVELPGCLTQADSFEELEEMIQDAMRVWIETALEDGQPVPEPRTSEQFSGKFVVRVPRSLHRQLVEAAEHDGVSLNMFVNVALAQTVGETFKA
jgi:antitoxin HicB